MIVHLRRQSRPDRGTLSSQRRSAQADSPPLSQTETKHRSGNDAHTNNLVAFGGIRTGNQRQVVAQGSQFFFEIKQCGTIPCLMAQSVAIDSASGNPAGLSQQLRESSMFMPNDSAWFINAGEPKRCGAQAPIDIATALECPLE